jgi:S-adenosylmethionine hydrolase
MAIITLTTDYGTKDPFVAILKANILSQIPDVRIMDVSHDIKPFQIHEGAYILGNAFKHFPKGTVHIVDIDSEKKANDSHIAFEYEGHYFVGPNNGFFTLMLDNEKINHLVALNIERSVDHHPSFPAKDIFTLAACHLAKGGTFEVIGKKQVNLIEKTGLTASLTDSGRKLKANVIYTDRLGNIVLNIKKPYFETCRKGRKFSITAFKKGASNVFRGRKISTEIAEISDYYSDKKVQEGDIVALFNSADYLEIAISRYDANINGGAALILGLNYGDSIQINFYDN